MVREIVKIFAGAPSEAEDVPPANDVSASVLDLDESTEKETDMKVIKLRLSQNAHYLIVSFLTRITMC